MANPFVSIKQWLPWRPGLQVLAGAYLSLLVLNVPSCRTVEQPPPGVPETPYWYLVADTAVWFMPAESLAVVQLKEGTPPDDAQDILYTLRDMGWRMTTYRGPALRQGGHYQELTQQTFQVERVEDAVSPVTEWDEFADRFGGQDGYFYNILPGLLADTAAPADYYWPASAMIIWSKHTTVTEAEAWLQSLGCEIISSPQMTHMYYVMRAWTVNLPPRERLFEWLRKLERDARVLQAHPVLANSEPPYPDARLVNEAPEEPDSEDFEKMSPAVRKAYWIAHFSEMTTHATQITRISSEFDKFHLQITTSGTPDQDSALVSRLGGRIVNSHLHRLEAWIPYERLPDLAADTLVTKIAGRLRPSYAPG